ncbi:hypothetical protein DID96_12380 [Burkholderia sp. Bp8963]|uniref:hypothetical protein n=1 Tax=Burkholderia sp. Bp8963 TaxID=2184547 RepID=UPI000F592EFB|nr:hypothetical protein [Burkholderia sp. Bp8963]RQS71529.1 hypothetical protein DID96_12380 [Burkholderia sp. Bp8963]
MTMQVTEHSVAGWQAFANTVSFVPDPMILRAGEVFANGAKGAKALAASDLEVMTALRDNIGGLIEFFDLLVAYDRMPLIDYEYTFDKDSVPMPIGTLLGDKALPVTIGYRAYESVKMGALRLLAAMDLGRIAQFGHQLAELNALRYQWRPRLDDGNQEGWLAQAAQLDPATQLAAQFLLGGLIFSGFAQASVTDHIMQPKRSRLYLALTAAPPTTGGVTHEEEEAVFTAAEQGLHGTRASARRLDALPPVLPYLLAKAPDTVTAADLLKQALDFANTNEGDSYHQAAALIRGDGIQAAQTADLAKAARAQAQALLTPFSKLADGEGGLKVEASVGFEGPKLSASKTLYAPAWLKLWWNDQTPFGGLRKTFRRMWLAHESYEALEKRLIAAWARG